MTTKVAKKKTPRTPLMRHVMKLEALDAVAREEVDEWSRWLGTQFDAWMVTLGELDESQQHQYMALRRQMQVRWSPRGSK